MRKSMLVVWLLAAAVFCAWTLGNPEKGEFQPVEGRENWEHRFDLSELKPGKYNLAVRGLDLAGNVAYAGPFNVFVDPDSDLPVAHISNPTSGQRVGTRLNVVGTCLDDDSVQRVEVQLDDGAFQAAQGGELWSLLLDLSAAEEGEHTLSVRGVDGNGTAGEPQSVRFQLDRQAPTVDVLSHPSGALVAGKVVLAGRVTDGNGVASLSVSADRERAGEFLKLDRDKSDGSYRFTYGLDTARFGDGPLVLWFRATDGLGSSGQRAFLLFVNNEAPLLEILWPPQDSAVNGRLMVAGRALDKIGLRELRYEASDGQAGTIPLQAGNPYWVHFLELDPAKKGSYQVTFVLTNLTGNRGTRRLTLRLDPEGDQPRVQIAYPAQNAEVGQSVFVAGSLLDDDGGGSIRYSLDGRAPVEMPAGEAFGFALEGLTAGRHTLSVSAKDLNGVAGEAVQTAFTVAAPKPVVVVTRLTADGTAAAYSPGAAVSESARVVLSGEIRFAGAAPKAEANIGGGPFKSLPLKRGEREGLLLFDFALPKEVPAGRIDVTVRAIGEGGRAGEYRALLYRGAVQESEAIVFSDARLGEGGLVRLTDGVPLQGFCAAGSVSAVRLDPPVPEVTISAEGERITIQPASPGLSGPTVVRVTTADGSSHQSGPLRFLTDSAGPRLALSSPQPGDWAASELRLEATVADDSPLGAVEYAVAGVAPFLPLAASAQGPEVRFAASADLRLQPDGPVLILLRASDAGGNTTLLPVVVRKDTTAPQILLVAPRPEDDLNGLVSLVGTVQDEGRVRRVEFTEDGKQMQAVAEGPAFRHDVNLSKYPSLPSTLALRATDAAGNSSLLGPTLRVNRDADRPRVEIQIPAEGERLQSDFSVSGMVFDDDGVQGLWYSVDGGQFAALEAGNNFSIPIAIAQVGDNEHTVTVKAVDVGGLESAPVSVRFFVSTSEPQSLLLFPRIDEVVRGVLLLQGSSADPNGIERVSISFDNGHSFHSVVGAETWQYPLDTRLVGDGTVALLIEAVDRLGVRGMFTTTISVDNHAPDLWLDSPQDGAELSRTLRLDGRAYDNLQLASLTVRLAPAGETAPPSGRPSLGRQFDLPTQEVFNQALDIADLPPGWYNLMLEATDKAQNRRYLARHVRVLAAEAADRIELLRPFVGAVCAGPLTVTGRVLSQRPTDSVSLMIDGQTLGSVSPDHRGYFRFEVQAGAVTAGEHELWVGAHSDPPLASQRQRLQMAESGGWVRIVSHTDGDFVTGRPYLEGQAGYLQHQSEGPEQAPGGGRRGPVPDRDVERVEVSFDNGKSFRPAAGKETWRVRLETQELPAGPLRVMVRATFTGGETAVGGVLLFADTTPPELALFAPREGGRFNESITVLGSARDNEALQEVTASLREGDKSRYAVPEFIQGLYLDLHGAGATYFDVGLGLTFFDDNVKLQLQVGVSPEGRFSGLVIGAKLLANILTVPFSSFLGPSWDFFSMGLAVGANFSYFTMSEDRIAFTDEGLVLGAMVAQLEFARMRIPEWRFLHTWSLYSEFQLWFISSDVEGGLAPRLSGGLRIGLL